MTKENFYQRCAGLFGIEYDYRPEPTIRNRLRYDGTIRNSYKTRWNGREPGNGRFPGHGLIRHFGSTIQVNLHTPRLSGYYLTEEEVLTQIKLALGLEGVVMSAS